MRSRGSSAVVSSAALGGLHVKLFLRNAKRIHYGSDDPVTGTVVLKYLPHVRGLPESTLNAELFGPLKLDVILKGTARVNHEDETRADVSNLFTKTINLHNAPFRAPPDTEHEFPISITFPESSRPRTNTSVVAVQDENGRWSFRESISSIEVDALPPSLDAKAKEPSSMTAKLVGLQTVVGVRYTIGAVVHMPGIDVNIINENVPNGYEAVYYERPRVPLQFATNNHTSTHDFSQTLTAQDESLRADDERPNGFMGKTKALLRSTEFPRYVFRATFARIPEHAFVGQPLSFNVCIATDPSSTTRIHPDVLLESCNIALLAHTTGTQPPNIETLRTKRCDVASSTPFSDQNGWTQTIDIGTLTWVPSSFTHDNIGRYYKLRIVCQLAVGKQKLTVKRDVPITIHPPLSLTEPPEFETEMPGLERTASLPAYEEDVPSYAQAVSTPAHMQA